MKTSRMTGDHLPFRPGLKQVVEGMEFHRFTYILMQYRVMMLLIFAVIIDIGLRFLDVTVAPWLYRQRSERRFIQPFEGFPAIAGQF
ncbi:hypothetical protein EKN38_22425 [Enterobacter sp. WCHEn045836]|nr:hypothetical protein EKN38_22425 [Enterobacter sp. WCHEn045836]